MYTQNSLPILTLYVAAGCGKTVLASTLVDEIESRCLGTLAYFYFSFSKPDESQQLDTFKFTLLTQIVKSLSREIAGSQDSFFLPEAFRKLYDRYAPSNHPKPEHTNETFRGILRQSSSTYIVIDALDECPSKTDQRDIIQFLAELVDGEDNLHIIITSRREENIESAFSKVTSRDKLTIEFNVYKVNKDIKDHLRERMDKK